jgi:hypothetical protein
MVPVLRRKPLGLQVRAHGLEDAPPKLVALQQMAELADRGLVGHRLMAQVDAGELANRHRLVQRLLNGRITEVEPVLQEVNAQHALQPHGRSAAACLRVVRLEQGAQIGPGQHRIHLGQELGSLGLLAEPVEPTARQRHLLVHPPPPTC